MCLRIAKSQLLLVAAFTLLASISAQPAQPAQREYIIPNYENEN